MNAGSREHELSYSRFMHGMKRSNLNFNRKTLAMLAQYEPYSFKAILDEIKLQNKFLSDSQVSGSDMDYFEAFSNKYLILGEQEEVDPSLYEQKWNEFNFDNMNLTPEEEKKIVIEKRRPQDGTYQNIFRE